MQAEINEYIEIGVKLFKEYVENYLDSWDTDWVNEGHCIIKNDLGEFMCLDLIFQPQRRYYHNYPNAMDLQAKVSTLEGKELHRVYLGTVDEQGRLHNFLESC